MLQRALLTTPRSLPPGGRRGPALDHGLLPGSVLRKAIRHSRSHERARGLRRRESGCPVAAWAATHIAGGRPPPVVYGRLENAVGVHGSTSSKSTTAYRLSPVKSTTAAALAEIVAGPDVAPRAVGRLPPADGRTPGTCQKPLKPVSFRSTSSRLLHRPSYQWRRHDAQYYGPASGEYSAPISQKLSCCLISNRLFAAPGSAGVQPARDSPEDGHHVRGDQHCPYRAQPVRGKPSFRLE